MADEHAEREPTRLSRRQAVGAAAAGAAALSLPQAAEAQRRRRRKRRRRKKVRRADVAIVGGGLAGLVAARDLQRAGKSVIVLEARRRLGGRCYSKKIAGAGDVANMGATFVGPTQKRILALCSELGIKTFKTYAAGENVLYFNGQRDTFTGDIPPVSPAALAEAAVSIATLDGMAKQVPLDAPWEAARAEEWDGMTVETWKRNNIKTADGRKLIDLAVEGIFSVEPRDMSLLFLLFYIHSAGNLDQLISISGGGQDQRVEGGTQQICEKLGDRIGRRRVLRRAYVRRIALKRGRLEVQSDRYTVRAKKVIVAIPPAMAARISYTPPLPALRDQMTQRVPTGSVIKVIAIYDKAFWRDENLSGYVLSDEPPVTVVFDGSPQGGVPGVLLGFVNGDDSRELTPKSHEERANACLESYARYFGEKARNPKEFFDFRWDQDRYARGCPVGVWPPGALLSFGRTIRQASNGIHWAGTETSTVWHGYMDGAVQSGERAAKEVLAAL